MLFPTIDFAVFFSVVLTLTWLVPAFSIRWKILVLAASYVFYGWWDVRFCLLLAGVTVGNQLAAVALARSAGRMRSAVLTVAIASDLAVLGYFKYAGFFASSFDNAMGSIGIHSSVPLVQVVLPVGISFFTFQAISYVVDVYRGKLRPGAWLDVWVFLSFFPHVVAGPIVRAAEFLPQLGPTREERGVEPSRGVEATRGVCLIVGGLAKKVVLASFLGTALVDPVFAQPSAHSSLESLMAVYGYAIQIWADFSGYTDIAIGCALLLGVRFPQNFDNPYSARSLQDFWRRWHMTLSRWLKDYLYIPLGGSRGPRWFTARNLMITMVLGGLWHGAAWTFVVWGALHGTFLVAERAWAERHSTRPAAPAARHLDWLWPRLLTFHCVCLAWVFFRADSLSNAFEVLARIVSAPGSAPLVTPAVLLAIGVGLAVQWVPRDAGPRLVAAISRLAPAVQGAAAGAALVLIGALGPQGVAPFIYYRF